MSQFSSSMPPPRAPRRPEPLRRGAELALLVGVAGPVLWLGGAPIGAAVLAALCCAAALALLSASNRGSLNLPPLAFIPLTAAAMIRAAPTLDGMPRSRSENQNAVVDATMAIITDSANSSGS